MDMPGSKSDPPSRKPITLSGLGSILLLAWHLTLGPAWQLAGSFGLTTGLLEDPWLSRIQQISAFQLQWNLWFLGVGVGLGIVSLMLSNRRKRVLNKKSAGPELVMLMLTGVAVCQAVVEFQNHGEALTLWAAVAACGVLMLAVLASRKRRRAA